MSKTVVVVVVVVEMAIGSWENGCIDDKDGSGDADGDR